MGQTSSVTSALDAIPLRRFDVGDGRWLWNSASAGRETEFIANEIFRDRCYEQHGISVRDGDVVIDAGANVGAFTISLIERCKGLTIVAVEPSPVTRTCLERNLADAPGRQRNEVRILPIALGARRDTLTLTYFPDAP